MAIDKVQQLFFQQYARDHVLQLREGQIVEGKVEQLYTDDKAKVRIGHSTLIAQLETALSVGKSYYFQVNEKNDQVYLQVVQGDGINRTADLDALLAKLQIKSSKVNRQFVNELISRGIPFNRSELEQALQILNNQSNKDVAREVLNKMFYAKLPITENVFQALATFNATDFSTMLQDVYRSLQQNGSNVTSEEVKLMELIQSFIHRPQSVDVTFNQLLLSQVKNEHQLFAILQMMGFFDHNVSREQVITYLENYIQSNGNSPFPLQQVNNKTQLQQLMSEMKTDITILLHQQSAITRIALTLFNMYHHIQLALLNEKEFSSLIKMLEQELIPLLPEKMGQQLGNELKKLTIHDQKQLSNMLKTLANHQIYTRLADFSNNTKQMMLENTSSSFHLKEGTSSILNEVFLQSEQSALSLIQQELAITKAINQLMHTHRAIQDGSMNRQEFTSLFRAIEQEIFPLLPNQMVEQVALILERFTVKNQSSLLHFLQALASNDFYTNIANQIQAMSQVETTQEQPSVPIQQQLLAQITQYMQSIGLTMEYDMMQAMQTADKNNLNALNQTDTIKSLLLHLIQQGGQQNKQIQQLVHFINGLQLHTLTETNQMLQAQLYIPGNPFSLNDDIFMKFESKKTDNEQIDADYCRIMFMLNLEQLQETLVDMQVQKRIITVTIFNDIVREVVGMESMKQRMRNNLQEINYQLSTVDWKPLSKQMEAPSRNQPKQNLPYEQEGFDLKI